MNHLGRRCTIRPTEYAEWAVELHAALKAGVTGVANDYRNTVGHALFANDYFIEFDAPIQLDRKGARPLRGMWVAMKDILWIEEEH